MVEHQLPKLVTRVRFPSPAQVFSKRQSRGNYSGNNFSFLLTEGANSVKF